MLNYTQLNCPFPQLSLKGECINIMNSVRYKKFIVDDEESLCEMMHSILKEEECNIDCAFSLKEGLEK